ncbi:putative serine-rich protein [Aspergillus undulatus]|uniref:putative serine-rich protein n=1 Tax=Aspergillus undulatus TaxID=1810928 RepID=UPI003CCCF635
MRSTNSSPRRRALHERTSSQTNEGSPPASVRAVSDKYPEQEERHVYTATPYPTKPEQVLPPRPGKGHDFIPDSRFHVDEGPSTSTGTYSTDISGTAESSLIDHSIADWDISSTFDAANTPPQLWEDDPSSSKTSFPDSELLEHERSGARQGSGSAATYSDEESTLPQNPPTIKTVPPDSASRQASSSGNSPVSTTSPNIVPIGPPSSPNCVSLDTSSLNFVRIGPSSNQDSASRSNSVSSLNSLGTVIRYADAAPWTHGSSSEFGPSRSQSFRSSPPYQPPSMGSNSTRRSVRSHSRSATSSSGSGPRPEIQQAILENGVFIQYPTIRAPSSSGSRVDSAQNSSSGDNLNQPTGDYSSGRHRSHLSTVPSQWSAESDSGFASPMGGNSRTMSLEPSPPPAALTRQRLTSSSVWMVNESEDDEFLDSVASLPPRPTNPGVPLSNSSSSRSSSVRSNQRPGTSSSFVANILPTWARMYYTAEEEAGNSTLALVEENNRPASALPPTSNSNVIQRFASVVSRARASTLETQTTSEKEKQPASDLRDPRSHWVKQPEPSVTRSGSSLHRLRHSWSPHLFPDRRVVAPKSSVWRAPSLDSRTEPILGRRNIQVWSFCLGFICPLTWLIASFLPLPPKPEMMMEENRGPELEVTLKARLYDLERRRHLNARWWRNLNRWMNPLGLVIVAIIITLAVVGTTVGF